MKTIFLTGATGNMGWAVFQELLKRKDRFHLRILARPNKANRKKLRAYLKNDFVDVIWGDMLNYESILTGVTGADFVVHLAAMVSPMADLHPEETMKTNVGSAENIVKAVQAQKNKNNIGLIYIGSVAQVGSNNPPHHWGRTGDPISPSAYDHYSLSKCIAERIFAESGLKKWVSIRQSGMLYAKLLMKANDPIMFHVPFKGVLEWTTIEDSGRAIANACEDTVPNSFWRGFYNLGSGDAFRLTNYEFERRLLDTIHCPPIEEIFELKWFATQNFHGQWFLDSDKLEEILHFRDNISCDDYFKKIKDQLPWYFSLAPIAPAFIIKFFMKQIAKKNPLGTLSWFKECNLDKINTYFGSIFQWTSTPGWEGFDKTAPTSEPIIRSHGYDETKPMSKLSPFEIQAAAEFRKGKCTSPIEGSKINPHTPLEWECQNKHQFTASVNTVLKGGHWCPECLKA